MSAEGTSTSSLMPQNGFSGTVYQMTDGRVRLPVGASERRDRDLSSRIRASFRKPSVVIMVVGPKGEAPKTTTALNLANALAVERIFPPFVLDCNPVGNIGTRIGHRTDCPRVSPLIAAIRANKIECMLDFNDYTVRTDVGARVTASDKIDLSGSNFGPDELEEVLDCAMKFYEAILLDTGNDPNGPLFKKMIEYADVIVLATTTISDNNDLAEDLANAIFKLNPQLREKMVSVITAKVPTQDKVHDAVAVRFREFSGTDSSGNPLVFKVGHDVPLRKVRDVFWQNILPATQLAARQLAAGVMDHALWLRYGEPEAQTQTQEAELVPESASQANVPDIVPSPPVQPTQRVPETVAIPAPVTAPVAESAPVTQSQPEQPAPAVQPPAVPDPVPVEAAPVEARPVQPDEPAQAVSLVGLAQSRTATAVAEPTRSAAPAQADDSSDGLPVAEED